MKSPIQIFTQDTMPGILITSVVISKQRRYILYSFLGVITNTKYQVKYTKDEKKKVFHFPFDRWQLKG